MRNYGRPHGSVLVRGIVASLGVVLFRLAMPWPLRGIIETLFQDPTRRSAFLIEFLPTWGNPAMWFGAAYLVLTAGAGFCELLQRVAMKQFAARTVHDLRGAAVRDALHAGANSAAPADLIARVIGDSARIKAGLSGILVHGFQSGLLYMGVSILLLAMSPQLAVFFLGAGALAVLVSARACGSVATSAHRHRRKEGAYAVVVEQAIQAGMGQRWDDQLNIASARKDVETTRLISRTTLVVHTVLAATLGVGLWVGHAGVKAGRLEPGDLFIFVAYTLIVHRRMVQLGRQLARGGKVLACTRRIAQLLVQPADNGPGPASHGPLRSMLRLEQVRLDSLRSHAARPRLRRTDLAIRAGSRVAVLGPPGSGKTSLLRVLAGMETPSKGTIRWDDELLMAPDRTLREQAGYLADYPLFSSRPVWRILGLPGPEAALSPEMMSLWHLLGIGKFLRGLPKGMREKVASATISRREARSLQLGSILGDSSCMWILDDPFATEGRKKTQRRLAAVLQRAKGRTVIVSLSGRVSLELFDRVLVLHHGRIIFDGTPNEWKEAENASTDSGCGPR